MYIETIDHSPIRPVGSVAHAEANDDPIMAAAVTVALLHQMKEVALACEECDELSQVLAKYGNNPDGIPALLYAIKVNDERAVDILLKNGASAFTRDHLNRNALYFAVDSGSMNLVKKFMALGVSPNEARNGADTAFFHAITERKNDIAKYIYDHEGQMYAQPTNYSAWEVCFAIGNYEMCKFLVDRGAEIRYYEEDDSRGIWFGFNSGARQYLCTSGDSSQYARSEKLKCLKYLIDKKLVALPRGAEAFSFAGMYPEVLEFLLDNHYLSANDRIKNGPPIIFYAATNQEFGAELIEILIKHGADVKAKVWDQTLLYFIAPTSKLSASELARTKTIYSILIKAGADLNGLLKRVGDDNFRTWLISQGAR